jgi:hypothetical protein
MQDVTFKKEEKIMKKNLGGQDMMHLNLNAVVNRD